MHVVSRKGRERSAQQGEYAADSFWTPRVRQMWKKMRKKALSRRDRSPCRRLTPPSLRGALVSVLRLTVDWVNIPSSFFSSSAGASAPPAAAPPAPPAAGAEAAPPPEPTFRSRSLTSLPSRAYFHIRNRVSHAIHSVVRTLANRVVQMGSTSSIFAALISDWSLSACNLLVKASVRSRA
jgi:hypothetical protein